MNLDLTRLWVNVRGRIGVSGALPQPIPWLCLILELRHSVDLLSGRRGLSGSVLHGVFLLCNELVQTRQRARNVPVVPGRADALHHVLSTLVVWLTDQAHEVPDLQLIQRR